MVLRTGQGREKEKLQHVDRQFFLDDLDVPDDRRGGIVWEAHDVAAKSCNLGPLPGEHHFAVVGDLVLTFLGAEETIWVDIFQADEAPPDPGLCAFLDEVRKLVTKCVDLDREPELPTLLLSKF